MTTDERKAELKALLQELQARILNDSITLEELNEILDREVPRPEEVVETKYGRAYIYAVLDPQGRRAYVGRSEDPEARHAQILGGRVKSPLVRMWVTIMKQSNFYPPMVVLEATNLLNWYTVHRAWVVRLQEKGEAYLNYL